MKLGYFIWLVCKLDAFRKLMKKSEQGVTLVELMISVGLMGMVFLGSASIFRNMNISKKKAELEANIAESSNIIKKIISKSKSNINWESFDFTESYYSNTATLGIPSLVTWTLANTNYINTDQQTFTINKVKLLRNSNLLEITNLSQGAGVMFSRCVDKSIYGTDQTFQEALDLPSVPMINMKTNPVKVYCCDKKSLTLCNTNAAKEVVNNSSTFRVKTYYQTPQVFQNFPAKGDQNIIMGVGIFLTFNSPLNPYQYKLNISVISEGCVGASRNDAGKGCSSFFKIKNDVISDRTFGSGLQERGFLDAN